MGRIGCEKNDEVHVANFTLRVASVELVLRPAQSERAAGRSSSAIRRIFAPLSSALIVFVLFLACC